MCKSCLAAVVLNHKGECGLAWVSLSKQFYGSAEVAVASALKSAVEFAIAEGFSKLLLKVMQRGSLIVLKSLRSL